MHILHLGLTNFRNYSRLELDLPPGIVILQGDNAQGKTNLLEAIYYLSRTHSPRTRTDRELLNWLVREDDLPFARLVARLQKREEPLLIELSLVQSAGKLTDSEQTSMHKSVRVNGAAKRAADAVGELSVVLFLPEDIELVAGSPHMRRDYLDDITCQIDHRYYRELQHYERVLTQRNYLLKTLRGRGNDSDELVFWNQHLVAHGSYIVTQRQQVIRRLNQAIQRIHPQLTGDQERLQLEYCTNVHMISTPITCPMDLALAKSQTASTDSADARPSRELQDMAAAFAMRLQEMRAKEFEQGVSLIGPHRDDVRFWVDGMDMHTYGSRGQQRTIALSVKLAEVELFAQGKREQPILLLDDVLSELDCTRRNCLMQAIQRAQQVIITSNDLGPYERDFLARATIWRVHAGRLESVALAQSSEDT